MKNLDNFTKIEMLIYLGSVDYYGTLGEMKTVFHCWRLDGMTNWNLNYFIDAVISHTTYPEKRQFAIELKKRIELRNLRI